jgi:selenocysteine lyase/cysteine desulfurase
MSQTSTAPLSARTDWRADFHEFDDVTYLNLAGMAPIPRAAAKALERAAEWKKRPDRLPETEFFGLPNRIRELLARLTGGAPDEFALASGASNGLAAVANGFEWHPDHEVLIAQGEFPAHFSTWMPLAQSGKLRVRIVKPAGRFLTTDDLVTAITPRTRVVSASHVRFDNGARIDPRRVADAVHAVDGYLLLDASQSLGAVPFSLPECGADFLVASGYKWLLGGFGTGVFWARRELIERLQARPFYWMALEGAENFSNLSRPDTTHKPVAAQARRWDAPETANFFNLAPLEKSLEFILGAGVQSVWEHNAQLIEQMIARLPVDRCVLASPRPQGQRGPYACFAARSLEATQALYHKLREEKIIVSLREGALRISPYLYNTERDIDRLTAAISV